MKVVPLFDRVLIKSIEGAEKVGGVWIPPSAQENTQQGEVVAIGGGRMTEQGVLIPMRVKAGDKVVFQRYSGTEIKIDGVDYLIVQEGHFLAVLED